MKTQLLACVVVLSAALVYGQDFKDTKPVPAEKETTAEPPAATRGSPASGGSAGRAHPRWEYSVLSREQVTARGGDDMRTGLNKLGDEGWELVTIYVGPGTSHYYFKRPKGPAVVGGGFGGFQGGFDRGGFWDGRSATSFPGGQERRGDRGFPFRQGGAPAGGDHPTVKTEIQVIALKHADAPALGRLLQELLQNSGTRVLSDERTNSLVVSASEEQLTTVRRLLEELDRPAAKGERK